MSITKFVPEVPQPVKVPCPICGQVSYSRGGIHPQCAVQQADEPRALRLRVARKVAADAEEKKREKNRAEGKVAAVGSPSTKRATR